MSGNMDRNDGAGIGQSPNDNPAQAGKNLLDNVSLMTTTLSPLPSQDSTMQRVLGSEALTSVDGTNFLGKVRDKMASDRITEEHENDNISTLTAFEDQLHERLHDMGSTAISSTPATATGRKQGFDDTAEVLHGFDLSPAHSIKKQPDLTPGGENNDQSHVMYGFDLSPVHSYGQEDHKPNTLDAEVHQVDSMALSRSFESKFQGRKNDSRAAPNFMQAKVASPRHSRSEKNSLNEDTETMMSQVFSSQDQSTSVKGIPKSSVNASAFDKGLKKATAKYTQNRKPRSPSTRVKRTDEKISDKRLQKKELNQHDYSHHSRSPSTLTKPSLTNGPIGSKLITAKQADPITPKSPKSRQTAVKVSRRVKSSPSVQANKTSPSRGSTKTTPRKLPLEDRKSPNVSRTQSAVDVSMGKKVPGQKTKDKGITGMPDSGVLMQMMQDLNEMRSNVREAQIELEAVSKEKEDLIRENNVLRGENTELRKDDFVMKSKIAHLASLSPSEAKYDSQTSKKEMESMNPVKESEVLKLKQEITEQERLLHGYQQENERIYLDLKKAKAASAETERAMYEENLKLKSEIANLQEVIDRSTRIQNSQKNSERRDTNFSERPSPKSNSPEGDDSMKKKIKILEHQVKMEEGLRRKSEAALRQATEKGDHIEKELGVNLCKMEETAEKLKHDHKVEIQTLKSKLEEAQSLLAARDVKCKTSTRIPTLYSKNDTSHMPASKSLLSHFQQRVSKLEEELEKRDSSANQAVQSVQHEYNTVKSKYEERINDLERQIKAFRANSKFNHLTELENLRSCNEAMKGQLSETLAKLRDESQSWKMEKDALINKMKLLQREKSPALKQGKTKEYAELENRLKSKEAEVERLTSLLHETRQCFMKNQPSSVRKKKGKREQQTGRDAITYNPGSFEGEGYTGLLEQNTNMKKRVENLTIELQHNKVINDALVVKLEQEAKRTCEKYEKEISLLKQKQAQADSSTNKDAERCDFLQRKITMLEQELDKCKAQVLQLKDEREEIVILRIREQALRVQVQHLLSEVHQANTQSPLQSSRKISHLEDKLRILEEQFRIKEEAFRDALVKNSSSVAQLEFRRLQEQLDAKNRQLTRFQIELDSIILILNELQSQGVKIPLPAHLQSIF